MSVQGAGVEKGLSLRAAERALRAAGHGTLRRLVAARRLDDGWPPDNKVRFIHAPPILPRRRARCVLAGRPRPLSAVPALADQPGLSPAQRRLTLTALAVVVLLSALDQTIVATAMPRIIEDLRGLSMYAWVTSAYLLASTVSVPIYGKLSDQYGRKPMLLLGMGLFLAGSVLCGLSGEFGDLPILGSGMMQLVVFRAVQGLGAGALMTVSFAVMADMYPPRERGRLFGVFGSMFGLASVLGPFIGGFLTDHATLTLAGHQIAGWRWVFYVNLPLGLLALFLILFKMPRLHRGGGGRVDYLGALLVVVSAGALLLALTFGGARQQWDAPDIIGLFVLSAVALAAFIRVQGQVSNPIIPLPLFQRPALAPAALASFVMSMAFLGVVMFMPLYMQVVQGMSATRSGVAMLPLMLSLIISSMLAGRLVSRTGRYKPIMIGGALLLLAGVYSLTSIGPETSSQSLAWRLLITGLGLGPAQTLFSLVIQNAAPARDVGVATSIGQFSRQMGSTVGVALFGTFLTHSLLVQLPQQLPAVPGVQESRVDLERAQSEAMHPQLIQERIAAQMQSREQLVRQAYGEDAEAVAQVLADEALPEPIKTPLRDGGLRAEVKSQLDEQVATIVAQLGEGVAGRDRLLSDPQLPEGVKQQLANVPVRALRDAQLNEQVRELFRTSLLAQEDALVNAAIAPALQQALTALQAHEAQLVADTQSGLQQAFAQAINFMMQRALWIVLLALLVVLFIAELPLRSRNEPEAADQPAAANDDGAAATGSARVS